ncbi:G-protein alpha subunit [Mycena filopes]|nr:G-protein alpha subunit [Mycena filopes]
MPAPADRLRAQTTSTASIDPLSFGLQPPSDESDEDRAARLEAAREAARVSRTIDVSLAEGRKALERKKRAVKILLLGQSESGKSSVLRNFRLAFTPKYFESERLVWKTVIQLNLISSIKKILEILQDEWDSPGPSSSSSPPSPTEPDSKPPSPKPSELGSVHKRLALSLSPLLAFETSISRLLDAEAVSVSGGSGAGYAGAGGGKNANGAGGGGGVTVRPGGGWKEKLAGFGRAAGSGSGSSPPSSSSPEAGSPVEGSEGNTDGGTGGNANAGGGGGGDPSLVTTVLAACTPEILALWADPAVRRLLEAREVRLEEESGFFLDDTARIAALDYVPSDRDIMRARIKTLGVEEHRFVTEAGLRAGTEFFITDVCGSSSQRSTWIPYFDDVQAILFLAPLAFWQSLDEDSKVNRVQDSLELWREIVGNPLLAKTAFILLFNKKDVLQAHINAGVMVKKYVPSFGDRPNDVASVTKYFRDKFSAYHRKFSPEPRPFIFYETEAIDTKSTAVILGEVQEQIIRNHLKDLDVIYTGTR